MDKSRPVSERVRPILDAMERSIDAARHRRLHPEGTAEPTSPPATPASPESIRRHHDETVPRLKARPKRPSSFSTFDGGYRSQAG